MTDPDALIPMGWTSHAGGSLGADNEDGLLPNKRGATEFPADANMQDWDMEDVNQGADEAMEVEPLRPASPIREAAREAATETLRHPSNTSIPKPLRTASGTSVRLRQCPKSLQARPCYIRLQTDCLKPRCKCVDCVINEAVLGHGQCQDRKENAAAVST